MRGADADLWVFDLDRVGSRTRITFGGDNRYYPVWTPDGARLTYSDGNVDGNTIYTTPTNGTGGPVALLENEGRQFPTSWSPDGSILAFHENVAGVTGRDLWTLRPVGEPEPFLVTPFEEVYPTFSPDGRWLAYASNETGVMQIYVQPFPGPGPKYAVSTDVGSEPVWSPAGRELFYRSRTHMVVVPVDPIDGDLRPGAPRPLFEDAYTPDPGNVGSPNYDVTPDGQRFVITRSGTAGEYIAAVVLHFTEELKLAGN